MKRLFGRLVNVLFVVLVLIAFFIIFSDIKDWSVFHMVTAPLFLFAMVVGLICGINYVLFGKFRVWNKTDGDH
jgi:hypothetical protein